MLLTITLTAPVAGSPGPAGPAGTPGPADPPGAGDRAGAPDPPAAGAGPAGADAATGPAHDRPASDLGFLLHKHPDRVQVFDQAFGRAHVFYPEAGQDRCTAALLLEVDTVRLVRARRRGSADFALGQYVNDRPYAASSLLAVALAAVFRTAMRGRCDARPDLAAADLPLRLRLPALPCRGGPDLARELFAPLGWRVEATPVPLDERFPEWGDSRYVQLTLSGRCRLADALNQLYVLLPVLDDAKHYWIAPDEVDKLIRAGTGWLADHPARGMITRRYLANRRALTRVALARLAEVDDTAPGGPDPIEEEPAAVDLTAAEPTLNEPGEPDPVPAASPGPPGTAAAPDASAAPPEPPPVPPAEPLAPAGQEPAGPQAPAEPPVPLAERRIQAVLDVLRAAETPRVIDLGCGSGKLLARLLDDGYFERVAGADVSQRAVSQALRRLRVDLLPKPRADRLEVFQGALTYADERFRGYDAAVLMEVVEHVDPPRLTAVERVVFRESRPRLVVVTTPNVEHNVRYEGLPAGRHRHPDHRFEWTRAQFRDWAGRVAAAYGYQVRHLPVGDDDPEVGPPTQMAVFALGGERT